MTTSKTTTFSTPSDHEIITERFFAAPRELVFRAHTDPAYIPQWWGPRYLTTTVDKLDLKPGGRWRFVQHNAEGQEFAFNGVFLEVVPPEKFVSTFEFEGMPGHSVTETIRFEEYEGGTKLVATAVYNSQADRDGMLNSGMQDGAIDSYLRLDEFLLTLTATSA